MAGRKLAASLRAARARLGHLGHVQMDRSSPARELAGLAAGQLVWVIWVIDCSVAQMTQSCELREYARGAVGGSLGHLGQIVIENKSHRRIAALHHLSLYLNPLNLIKIMTQMTQNPIFASADGALALGHPLIFHDPNMTQMTQQMTQSWPAENYFYPL